MEQAIFSGAVDNYHVKAVSRAEEATALLSIDFEYVTEIDGKRLFRKRKWWLEAVELMKKMVYFVIRCWVAMSPAQPLPFFLYSVIFEKNLSS
jgi:hypothetical protein